MALVGSLSGSAGTIAVTGSLIPGDVIYDLGSTGSKWRSVYANNLTGSIKTTSAGDDFIKAGPNITAYYNTLGQWEITGAAAPASEKIFTGLSTSTAYTTSSISIGFNQAASTKGSDVFFAVSGSNPAANTSAFSGPIVTSGSLTLKDPVSNNVVAFIDGLGNISGSSFTTSGTAIITGSLTVKSTISGSGNISTNANVDVNGGNINTTAATFNIASSAITINVGSAASRVVVPGDFEVQGTTTTVSASNLVIKDPLVGFGFASGSIPGGSTGDRGFVGGYTGAGNNVAFGYSLANSSFVASKTTSDATANTFAVNDLLPVRASSLQVNGTLAQITSSDGSILAVSGSRLDMKAGPSGVFLYRDGTQFALIGSGSYSGGSGNTAKILSVANDVLVGAAVGYNTYVSGSTVYSDAGGLGTIFRKDGTAFAAIEQVSANEAYLSAKSPVTTAYVFNSQATTLNIGGAATSVSIGAGSGTTTVKNNFVVSGSTYIGDTSSDVLQVLALVTGSLIPWGDKVTDLGSASNRWANIYTGDLHLRNERGDYTLIEEADFLSIRFNKTGKRYKFLLEPVPELDE